MSIFQAHIKADKFDDQHYLFTLHLQKLTEENKNEIKKLDKKNKDQVDKLKAEMAQMKLTYEEGLQKFHDDIGGIVKNRITSFENTQGKDLSNCFRVDKRAYVNRFSLL